MATSESFDNKEVCLFIDDDDDDKDFRGKITSTSDHPLHDEEEDDDNISENNNLSNLLSGHSKFQQAKTSTPLKFYFDKAVESAPLLTPSIAQSPVQASCTEGFQPPSSFNLNYSDLFGSSKNMDEQKINCMNFASSNVEDTTLDSSHDVHKLLCTRTPILLRPNDEISYLSKDLSASRETLASRRGTNLSLNMSGNQLGTIESPTSTEISSASTTAFRFSLTGLFDSMGRRKTLETESPIELSEPITPSPINPPTRLDSSQLPTLQPPASRVSFPMVLLLMIHNIFLDLATTPIAWIKMIYHICRQDLKFFFIFALKVGSILGLAADIGSDYIICADYYMKKLICEEEDVADIESTKKSFYGPAHPGWFGFTLLFIYLPQIIKVWGSSMEKLIHLYIYQRVEIRSEKLQGTNLKNFFQFIINIKERSRKLCWLLFCLYYIFISIFKIILCSILPILVILRQTGKIRIWCRITDLQMKMGLIKTKDYEPYPKVESLKVHATKYEESLWKKIEDWIFPPNKNSYGYCFCCVHRERKNKSKTKNRKQKSEDYSVLEQNKLKLQDKIDTIDFNSKSGTLIEVLKAAFKEGKGEETEMSKLFRHLVILSEESIEDAFFESAPQAILQIYIFLGCDSNMLTFNRVFTIGSSLVTLALAISDYIDTKLKMHPLKEDPTLLGYLLIVFWKLPIVSAKCISLAVLLSYFTSGGFILFATMILIGAGVEFNYMDTKLLFQDTKKCSCIRLLTFQHIFLRLFNRGWIFIFTFLEHRTTYRDPDKKIWKDANDLTTNKATTNYLKHIFCYHIFSTFINLTIMVPWYHMNGEKSIGSISVVLFIAFSSVFSILFMLMFEAARNSQETEDNIFKGLKKKCFVMSENCFEALFSYLKKQITLNSVIVINCLEALNENDREKLLNIESSGLLETALKSSITKREDIRLFTYLKINKFIDGQITIQDKLQEIIDKNIFKMALEELDILDILFSYIATLPIASLKDYTRLHLLLFLTDDGNTPLKLLKNPGNDDRIQKLEINLFDLLQNIVENSKFCERDSLIDENVKKGDKPENIIYFVTNLEISSIKNNILQTDINSNNLITLETCLAQNTPLDMKEISKQILIFIMELHEKGFVHLNLNPSSIVLTKDSKSSKYIAQISGFKKTIRMRPLFKDITIYHEDMQKYDIWCLSVMMYLMYIVDRGMNQKVKIIREHLLKINYEKWNSTSTTEETKKLIIEELDFNLCSKNPLLKHVIKLGIGYNDLPFPSAKQFLSSAFFWNSEEVNKFFVEAINSSLQLRFGRSSNSHILADLEKYSTIVTGNNFKYLLGVRKEWEETVKENSKVQEFNTKSTVDALRFIRNSQSLKLCSFKDCLNRMPNLFSALLKFFLKHHTNLRLEFLENKYKHDNYWFKKKVYNIEIVELETPRWDGFEPKMSSLSASVTSGLQQTIKSMNAALYEINKSLKTSSSRDTNSLSEYISTEDYPLQISDKLSPVKKRQSQKRVFLRMKDKIQNLSSEFQRQNELEEYIQFLREGYFLFKKNEKLKLEIKVKEFERNLDLSIQTVDDDRATSKQLPLQADLQCKLLNQLESELNCGFWQFSSDLNEEKALEFKLKILKVFIEETKEEIKENEVNLEETRKIIVDERKKKVLTKKMNEIKGEKIKRFVEKEKIMKEENPTVMISCMKSLIEKSRKEYV